jgi:hypothetical protein
LPTTHRLERKALQIMPIAKGVQEAGKKGKLVLVNGSQAALTKGSALHKATEIVSSMASLEKHMGTCILPISEGSGGDGVGMMEQRQRYDPGRNLYIVPAKLNRK